MLLQSNPALRTPRYYGQFSDHFTFLGNCPPTPPLNLLRAKCWLRGGVGGQFHRNVKWSQFSWYLGNCKPSHFLWVQTAQYWHPVNTDTFFGPSSGSLLTGFDCIYSGKGWLQGLVWEMETPFDRLLLYQAPAVYILNRCYNAYSLAFSFASVWRSSSVRKAGLHRQALPTEVENGLCLTTFQNRCHNRAYTYL